MSIHVTGKLINDTTLTRKAFWQLFNHCFFSCLYSRSTLRKTLRLNQRLDKAYSLYRPASCLSLAGGIRKLSQSVFWLSLSHPFVCEVLQWIRHLLPGQVAVGSSKYKRPLLGSAVTRQERTFAATDHLRIFRRKNPRCFFLALVNLDVVSNQSIPPSRWSQAPASPIRRLAASGVQSRHPHIVLPSLYHACKVPAQSKRSFVSDASYFPPSVSKTFCHILPLVIGKPFTF